MQFIVLIHVYYMILSTYFKIYFSFLNVRNGNLFEIINIQSFDFLIFVLAYAYFNACVFAHLFSTLQIIFFFNYLDVCVVHSSSMTVLWTTINSSDSFDRRIQMIQRFLHVRCWKAKSKCWLLKIVFCSIFISNDRHLIFWGFGLTEYFIKYHTS